VPRTFVEEGARNSVPTAERAGAAIEDYSGLSPKALIRDEVELGGNG
jgi:hypothetical protein